MNFRERIGMGDPSVKIWVPDQTMVPEAHDVLQKAARNPRVQEGLKRLATDFGLKSLDVTIRTNDDHEDGVPDCMIVLVFSQNTVTHFSKRDLMAQARSVLGRDMDITNRGYSNAPQALDARLSEDSRKYGSTCAFDSSAGQGRGGPSKGTG